MLRTVDDWFIKTKTNLYGQDETGKIIPFDQAFFRGFRGEGGARDAERLLRKSGEVSLSLTRLEMRIVKQKESDRICFGREWVIVHKYQTRFIVYGPNNIISGVLRLSLNGFNTFKELSEAKKIANDFTRSHKFKSKFVRLASWALYVL